LNIPNSILVTIDLCVFRIVNNELQLLLTERSQEPEDGKWALPGGIINSTSDCQLEDTVTRITQEKLNLQIAHFEQVCSIGNSLRDPRGWSLTCLYFCIISEEQQKALSAGRGTAKLDWKNVQQLSNDFQLAFDHQSLIQKAVKRLHDKSGYTLLPTAFMPKEFTLGELQKTFEVASGQTLEKKTFRRRIDKSDLFEDTGKSKIAGKRPAKLYKVKADYLQYLFDYSL
jgi:8-oxo-dGTP diphosphatase